MLPQVGQGALAVECRADDDAMRARLDAIDDRDVREAVTAERAFLARLGSGCSLPVAASARVAADGVEIEGLVASYDGARTARATLADSDPIRAGEQLADTLQQTFGQVA
jgi:hydroxymethylbilane synthase